MFFSHREGRTAKPLKWQDITRLLANFLHVNNFKRTFDGGKKLVGRMM